MKYLMMSAAVFAGALCVFAARLTDEGLTVHEWGTFTSVADSSGSPTDWNTLGCTSELPKFVEENRNGWIKVQARATVRMETPVIYFYSQREVDAHVKVSFPNGAITEWYPKASGNMNRWDPNLVGQTGGIEWKSVKVQPGATQEFRTENDGSRYYAARATDAAPVRVDNEQEKFLFYRGVARTGVPLKAQVREDSSVVIHNSGAAGVTDAIRFENRGGSLGYTRLSAIGNGVAADRPVLGRSATELRSEVEKMLFENGLYPKEAAAVIDTWRDSWFEEGSRIIYIVPENAVNAMLPLEIEPAPAKVKRVFVGRIELITPETKSLVSSALARNDRMALRAYGRFLEPIASAIGAKVNLSCSALQ